MPPSRQRIAANSDGTFTINLPKPGKYSISYADGRKKGQIIKTVEVTKAGPVSFANPISSLQNN
jgi:hypothetical protein